VNNTPSHFHPQINQTLPQIIHILVAELGVMAVGRLQIWCDEAWWLASFSSCSGHLFRHFRRSVMYDIHYRVQRTGRDLHVLISGTLNSEFVAAVLGCVSSPSHTLYSACMCACHYHPSIGDSRFRSLFSNVSSLPFV